MHKQQLFQARQIWVALFRAKAPCPNWLWVSWAEEQIMAAEGTPEWWLWELALAEDQDKALGAVLCDIYADYEIYPDAVFDEWGLIIGMTVDRYVNGELTNQQMWRVLNKVSDIAQFLDSGAYLEFTVDEDLSGILVPADFDEYTKRLLPVASYARNLAKAFLPILV
jgi:hypothetical protein